ncbi:hypothetical protein BUQ74_05410 [Leptospira weilii serovar Heyan]|nr:hypothetical protein BUQ74_05410 [Leptospira weilii serovar Heyan]
MINNLFETGLIFRKFRFTKYKFLIIYILIFSFKIISGRIFTNFNLRKYRENIPAFSIKITIHTELLSQILFQKPERTRLKTTY